MAWIQYAQSVGDGMQMFWYNDETGETSFDDLPPQRVQQIWNSTPGGIDQKLAAVAKEGPGYAGAIDLVAKAGIVPQEVLNASGTGIAVQQASADKGGLGGFLSDAGKVALGSVGFGVGGATAASALTGNDVKTGAALDLAGLAAAPVAAAALPATGLSTLTGAAPAATGTTAATAAAEPYFGATAVGATEAAPSALEPYFGAMSVAPDGAAPALGGAEGGSLAGGSVGATSGGMAGTALGVGAGTAGGTALSRLIDNNPANPAGTADYLSAAGILGATGLGIYGANQQANALSDVASKEDARIREMMAFGAPYRGRLESLYADPSSYLNSPEVQLPTQQATDAVLRGLSTKGNPYGNPAALQTAQDYTATKLYGMLGQEKDRLGGLGGLTAYNAAAAKGPDLSPTVGAINAQGGMYDSLGYGISQITNPRRSLSDYLRSLT